MAAKKSTAKATAAKSTGKKKSSRKKAEVVEETRDEMRARVAFERRQALREKQGIA